MKACLARTAAGLLLGSTVLLMGAVLTGAATPSAGGGSITGTVMDGSGQPVSGVCAVATSKQHGEGVACTDATGTYSVPGLDQGRYTVFFLPYASDTYLVPQVYPGHPGLDLKQGQRVAVRSGQVTDGIDATLHDGGRVEVLVKSATGDPLSDESVCPLFDSVNAPDGNCGGTDLTGRGTTGAAPAGETKMVAIGVDNRVYSGGMHSYSRATGVAVPLDATTFVEITIPSH